MCRAVGCTRCSARQQHFCKICGDTNSMHRSASCPRRKKCRVPGCTRCAPGKTHFCKSCGNTDSTHRSMQCPVATQQFIIFGTGPPQTITKVSIAVVFTEQQIKYVVIASRGVPGGGRNKITTAGGGVERKETPRQAALRELYEEFGIRLQLTNKIGVCYHGATAHFIVVLEGPPQISHPSHVHEICGDPRNVHTYFSDDIRIPMWKERTQQGDVTRIWGVPLSMFHTQYEAMMKDNALFAHGGIFGFLFQNWKRSQQLLGI